MDHVAKVRGPMMDDAENSKRKPKRKISHFITQGRQLEHDASCKQALTPRTVPSLQVASAHSHETTSSYLPYTTEAPTSL